MCVYDQFIVSLGLIFTTLSYSVLITLLKGIIGVVVIATFYFLINITKKRPLKVVGF